MAPVSKIVDDKVPQSTNEKRERDSEEAEVEEEGLTSDGDESDCSYDDGRYYRLRTDEEVEEVLRNPLLIDDTLSEEVNQLWRLHLTQDIKSDGFDIDVFPNVNWMGGLRPVDLTDERQREDVANRAKYAIKRHNAKKPEQLEFVDIIKAIGGCGNWSYFITLRARVIDTDDIKTYQAHVEGLGSDLFLYRFRPNPVQN